MFRRNALFLVAAAGCVGARIETCVPKYQSDCGIYLRAINNRGEVAGTLDGVAFRWTRSEDGSLHSEARDQLIEPGIVPQRIEPRPHLEEGECGLTS